MGVITSKFPKLEDRGEMKERVLQAAGFIARGVGQTVEEALGRVGVSPQCGFASHAEGNLVAWGDMVEKLELVREVAEMIWPGEA